MGDPVRHRVFSGDTSGSRRATVEVWLYPAHKLHQDQLHSHGAISFRLTFIDGRLAIIEPISLRVTVGSRRFDTA